MDIGGVIVKCLGPLLGAIFPPFKRRLKERSAGRNPERVARLSDQLIDPAFERLGTLSPDDPFWMQCLKGVEASAVRPEVFQKPALRQWVTEPHVRALFKQAVESHLAETDPDQGVLGKLADEYASATGEDRRLAVGPISVAIAFLQASVYAAVRDSGTAAVVLASTAELGHRIDAGVADIVEAAALARNPHIAERLTAEARHELDKILRRRATPGQRTAIDLKSLIADLGDSRRFAAADKSVRLDATCWLARVEAGAGDAASASALLDSLSRDGFAPPSAALALLDMANGEPAAALRRVRDKSDPDSQTAAFHIILKSAGSNDALDYVASLRQNGPGAFTAVGWNNICATLIGDGQMAAAVSILGELPPQLRSGCTHLAYLHAVSTLLPMLPLERRESLISLGFSSVAEHVLDSDESRAALLKARQAAKETLELAKQADDQTIAARCEAGIRGLNLVDPSTRSIEESSIRNDMSDGAAAVNLIWLARAYEIDFDPEPLERHLDRAQRLGGLTEDQLRARLYLLNVPTRSAELVRFLDDEWDNLLPNNNPAALTAMKVQALATVGDIDGARAFLDSNKSSLDAATVPRLELMLREASGEDPSDAAIALFNESRTIEDLTNVVHILQAKKSWKRLAPFAEELYLREPNFESAMLRHMCMKATRTAPREVSDFLEGAARQVEQRPELQAVRAWASYEAGDHGAAKQLNDKLLSVRQEPNDIALDINIAICTGDWERFAVIGTTAWAMKERLDSRMLLSLAKLVGFSDQTRALSLAEEAVSRDGENPQVLVGAHTVAIAARRDDLAMPWIHKAAELSKENGPVSMFSHRELIEFMRSRADSWRHKNELYRTGQVPLHLAASMFNAPLSQMLVAVPRQNAASADPRRRQPVPFRAGNRQPIAPITAQRVALDITALLVLSELELLPQVLNLFAEVYVSPRLMEVLLEDRERATFHQPSRVAEVKPLMGFFGGGRLIPIDERGPENLIQEVGDESASLLTAASKQGGRYVHPGELFKVSTFMEETASIGEMASLVADPIGIAAALRDEGIITGTACDAAVEILRRTGSVVRQPVALGCPIFLDSLSVEYLQQAGLLEPLLNSQHKVFVHRSTVEEWQALLATEPMASDLIAAVDALRLTVRAGLLSGKVKFLSQSRRQRGRLSATTLLPILDLLADASSVDAAVIDDRCLGASPSLTDGSGKTVPVFSTLDLLDELVDRRAVTAARRREIRHLLRARCLFCVPIDHDEIRVHLDAATVFEGKVRETAELRVIRQYLARLNSTDVLCTPADLAFQDMLWRVGTQAIATLWSDATIPISDAQAKCNWVAENLVPEIELAMRFADEPDRRMVDVAAAQLQASVIVASADRDRRAACQAWYDQNVLSNYLPANSEVLDATAALCGPDLIRRTVEIANELRSRDYSTPTQ